MDERDGMRDFLRYHRRMLFVMLLACASGLAGLAIGGPGDGSWAIGFGIGAAAQLVKFGFIDIAVVRRLAAGKTDAAAAQLKAMVCSLIMLGIAIVAVYNLGGNVWAVAAGIFLPRMILVADTWIRPDPFRIRS